MEIIKDAIMSTVDPGISSKIKGREVGESIEHFSMTLSSDREINTEEILKRGPLLLVFIRGTWCPFCNIHMSRIRKWAQNIDSNSGTVIIISSETTNAIRQWLEKNPMTTLFASDSSLEIAKKFGVYIAPREFSQAATFLIDVDSKIKVAYKGKRTRASVNDIGKSFNETIKVRT